MFYEFGYNTDRLREGQSDLGLVSGDASHGDFLLCALGQRFPGDQDRI